MSNVGQFDSVARELLDPEIVASVTSGVLHAEWISVRKPLKLMGLERRDGPSFIEPDVFHRTGVVTPLRSNGWRARFRAE